MGKLRRDYVLKDLYLITALEKNNNMGRPRGHYAKWNKSGKEKYGRISLTCGI